MASPLLILHKVPGADAMMPHAAQLKAFGKRFQIKTRKNDIVDCPDYQIPVTQPMEAKGE